MTDDIREIPVTDATQGELATISYNSFTNASKIIFALVWESVKKTIPNVNGRV